MPLLFHKVNFSGNSHQIMASPLNIVFKKYKKIKSLFGGFPRFFEENIK